MKFHKLNIAIQDITSTSSAHPLYVIVFISKIYSTIYYNLFSSYLSLKQKKGNPLMLPITGLYSLTQLFIYDIM